MAAEIFDVDAALKEFPESEVAQHLAELHGIDRAAYLKEGLTDADFLKEHGHMTLPSAEAPVQAQPQPQQPAAKTDGGVPLLGGLLGTAAGSAAAGVTNMPTLAKKAIGMFANSANAPEAAGRQFSSPTEVAQRSARNIAASIVNPELHGSTSDVYNWSAGKQAESGQYGKENFLGGANQEHEANLQRLRAKIEAENPMYTVLPGTNGMIGPKTEADRMRQEARQRASNIRNAAGTLASEDANMRAARLKVQQELLKRKAAGERLQMPFKAAGFKPVMGGLAGYNAADALQQAAAGNYMKSALGAAGTLQALAPMMKNLTPRQRAAAMAGSIVAPLINRASDHADGGSIQGYADGGSIQHFGGGNKVSKLIGGLETLIGKQPHAPVVQTVNNPLRLAFPGIYKRPDVIAAEAAARVAPESDALKRLFGVTRDDLYQMGKGRVGNISGVLPGAAKNPKGAKSAMGVMNPQNEQRIIDVLTEAEKHPELVKGMDPWYVMDPAFHRMAELMGHDEAVKNYKQFNTLLGMASPGSDVLTEMNRGTAANYLANQNRFGDFEKFGGKGFNPEAPPDIQNILGHPYHKTSQAAPMRQYLDTGEIQMSSPKVPMYIQASGVPETGFQTDVPVGDAHWSRAVGLADTRGDATRKGKIVIPGASVTNSEMSTLAPWWSENIAAPVGLQSVPAQARAWGAFSPQTGVESPIGAPKLELLATQIMAAADRMGVSPETARDMILTGKAYAGKKEGGLIDEPTLNSLFE